MNDLLKKVIGKFVLVYLDDIIIFSKDKAGHCKHLEIVLQLQREHQHCMQISLIASLSSLSCNFWLTLLRPKGCGWTPKCLHCAGLARCQRQN